MPFSVNAQIIIAVVVLVTCLMQTHTSMSLVRASLLVGEQVSIYNNNINNNDNNTDQKTAFIYLKESLLHDKESIAAKQHGNIFINATNVFATISDSARVLKRGKRYLDFLNGSRMFFRVNVKNNIVPKPVIWAHGYGFRCNFPIENEKSVRPFRRNTYKILRDLMNQNGFDGKACILKAFCAAHIYDNGDVKKGMLFKLLKYIFTLNDDDKRHFPYLNHKNCRHILHSHCPLSFNNISPFTDDV